MKKRIVLIVGMIAALALIIGSVQAAVVLSNLGETPSGSYTFGPVDIEGYEGEGFAVPAGPAYQLNSVTALLQLDFSDGFETAPALQPASALATFELWTGSGNVPESFVAVIGSTLVSSTTYQLYTVPASGTILLEGGNNYFVVAYGSAMVNWATSTPAPTGVFTAIGEVYTEGGPTWYFESSGHVMLAIDASLPGETTEAVPGCDALIAIPSTAVGATFTSDAEVYWKPGELTSPLVTLQAGKTVRAIGRDATGEYTKILYVCDFLWVKTNTLGPNYEAPWYGAPLPTGVVE